MDESRIGHDQDTSIWQSAKEYATALGHWGWVVIVGGILGELVTVVVFFVTLAHAPMPNTGAAWIWLLLSIIVLTLVGIPFSQRYPPSRL
jgi:hypothetical protein